MKKSDRNLAGVRFGRWLVLAKAEVAGKARWVCRCECGTEKLVLEQSLLIGDSTSCGRGHLPPGWDATYQSWRHMISRCHDETDPSYARYGGKGITVCDRWRESFHSFYEDMGPRPDGKTIDRIDGRHGYAPANCRWATIAEQQSNLRNNRFVECEGRRLTLAQLSRETGVPYTTIFSRLKKGRSPV